MPSASPQLCPPVCQGFALTHLKDGRGSREESLTRVHVFRRFSATRLHETFPSLALKRIQAASALQEQLRQLRSPGTARTALRVANEGDIYQAGTWGGHTRGSSDVSCWEWVSSTFDLNTADVGHSSHMNLNETHVC